MIKEMVPIMLSCGVWGSDLHRKSVCFQCNNYSVVAALIKGSAEELTVMHLLWSLWLFIAYYNIHLTATHILGLANLTANVCPNVKCTHFLL